MADAIEKIKYIYHVIEQDFPHSDDDLDRVAELIKDGDLGSEDLRVMLEKAYRRGVVQGANYVYTASFDKGHSNIDIRKWIDDDLHMKWRNETTCREVIYPLEID